MVEVLQDFGVEEYLIIWMSYEYILLIDFLFDIDFFVWQFEYCDLFGRWIIVWDSGVLNGDGYYWVEILYCVLIVGNVNVYFWWLVI